MRGVEQRLRRTQRPVIVPQPGGERQRALDAIGIGFDN